MLDLSSLLPSDIDGIVKYVPKWFPGAEFQRLVAKWKTHTYNARDGPFNEAKDAYVSIPVLFSISLETQNREPERVETTSEIVSFVIRRTEAAMGEVRSFLFGAPRLRRVGRPSVGL